MSLGSFFKLVEIQTKVASVIPFFLGTIYALYRFNEFNLRNFLLMFVSLITFDMATTAINNYMDYKKAHKTHGYGYESHNAIVRDNLRESAVVTVIILLLSTASVFGVLLFLNTNGVVLALGIISFIVGVMYSFGPVPISRTPLGEVFSGFFMGFIIVFLSVYVHVYDQNVVMLSYQKGNLQLSLSIVEVLYVFLLSLSAVSGIANIMLANNICDIEDDIENKRYTLPIYIGRVRALKVFAALYYVAYLDLVVLLLLKVVPVFAVLALATIILVQRNINAFFKKQTKKDTFVFSVQNFVLMNVALIISIGAGVLMNLWR